MGLFDFFKKKKKDKPLLLTDLTLVDMKPGYFVDYNLRTWEVTAYNEYSFDDDESAREWELTDGKDRLYLECTEDDGLNWCVTKKIPVGKLGKVRSSIMKHGEPPEKIEYEGAKYYLDATGLGYFYPGGKGRGEAEEYVFWEFLCDDEIHTIGVEQWSEHDLDASVGLFVHEDKFSSILPGKADLDLEL